MRAGNYILILFDILGFYPWSLDLCIRVPFQLQDNHTVLQPFRRMELIVNIVIYGIPSTHLLPEGKKHVRVKCIAQGHTHRNNVPTLRGEKHDITHAPNGE